MRHRKTPAELATEALVQAGLRAPNVRSFELDSEEAHEALCTPPDPMLIRGCLPPEPRRRELEVIVEPRAGRGRR